MIYRNQKHRLQFGSYIPGIITLSLILPICMLALLQHPSFEKLYTLEVNFYSPRDMRAKPTEFPPARDYVVMAINGNERQDKFKLDLAQLAIRDILHEYDTARGVRIHFDPTARYESFVRALNICLVEESLTQVSYKNDLWIFNRFPSEERKQILYWTCGTMDAVVQLPSCTPSFSMFPFIYKLDAELWPLAVVLVAMILVSFRSATNL